MVDVNSAQAATEPLPITTTPAVENVDQNVFIKPLPGDINRQDPIPTAQTVSDTPTPAVLPTPVIAPVTATVRDPLQAPDLYAEGLINTPITKDTSIETMNLRRTGAAYDADLLSTQSRNNSDTGIIYERKQNKPLRERFDINDYLDINYTDIGNGKMSVDVQGYGGKDSKGVTGDTEKRTSTIDKRKLLGSMQSVIGYGSVYDQLNSRDKAIGAFGAFFDSIDPFFPEGERPEFSMAGNRLDTIDFAGQMADTFNLASNWGNISEFSKYRRTANELIKTADVLGMGDKVPLNARGSLGMVNFGYSAYTLLNNWDKYTPVQRVFGIINTINAGSSAINGGVAMYNATVTGTATVVGGGGVAVASGGAVTGGAAAGGAVTGGAVTGGAEAVTPWATAGKYLSYAAAAYAAYNIIDQWGEGGARGRSNGAMNGATIGMTLYNGPGAVVGAIVGIAIGSINTGKSDQQASRDAYRDHYENNGLIEKIEKSHNIQLADGSFYDVGTDGSEGRASYAGEKKKVWDQSRIPESQRSNWTKDGNVRPYDIDGTNDLDYLTSLATQGLNIIMNGGSNYRSNEGRQMNGYLTNAATSNTGSREFTEENFNVAMDNVRSFYAKIGINDIESAMGYIEGLKQDKRISTDDYNAARIGIDFVFGDGGFARAQETNKQLGRTDRSAPTEEELLLAEERDRISRLEVGQEKDRGRTPGGSARTPEFERRQIEEERERERERVAALQEQF